MPGNSIGQIFKVTTFGESHGGIIGVVIDGCPAGLPINFEFIQAQLEKRKPGQSKITTQRKEEDVAEFISGIFENVTTGMPIAALITNQDAKFKDYDHIKNKYRPSHADMTYDKKYGHRDYRGGGRSSARETACRVMAGGVAQLLLQKYGIEVFAYVSQVGNLEVKEKYTDLDLTKTFDNIVRCPQPEMAKKMIALIEETRRAGDTIGGTITGIIKHCPIGLGEPVFDRLHADLGKAMLSINACKGFEYGSGFQGAMNLKGSEHNDIFKNKDGKIVTQTNHSGGIQGGISNGMDIYFKVAFKPVATILRSQQTVDDEGNEVTVEGRGRHDPCVLPRAVPIVEAMAALTLADHLLRARCTKIDFKS
jgi:chorismate synthase